MNRTTALFLAPLALFLLIIGCKKVDQLLPFYLDDSRNIRIPASPLFGQLVSLTPLTVTTKSKDSFKNNNTRADFVKDVSLNKITLTITNLQRPEFRLSAKRQKSTLAPIRATRFAWPTSTQCPATPPASS